MTTTHTRGPMEQWLEVNCRERWMTPGEPFCVVYEGAALGACAREQDAIRAELLEALEAIVPFAVYLAVKSDRDVEMRERIAATLDLANAAIAKARGK